MRRQGESTCASTPPGGAAGHRWRTALTCKLAAVSAALVFSNAPATAETYPSRRITIAVPYAAGGPTDGAARVMGEHMAATLGQSIVVENVTGGGGAIAVGRVARATPDGYTLLLHQLALAANVTLMKLPFDTERDLIGIGLINYSPMVLVGRKTLAADTFADLAQWMKGAGANVRFAHAGAGTLAHLCAALIAQSVGTPVSHVAYRGGVPAITDTLAGHTDLYCSAPSTAIEQVRAGLLKAYVATARERMPALPDVPSAVEVGRPELDFQLWQALFAAAGTPPDVIDRLDLAVRKALADRGVQKAFTDTGMTAYAAADQGPDAATAKLRSEIKRWAEVIHANHIEAAN